VGRERVRLGIDANIAEGLDAGIRLATGNIQNPVSTNQTLGNYDGRYQFTLDRAFLQYNRVNDDKFNWLTLMGGRTLNPFFTGGSEILWDEDLSFQGALGTVRHRFGASELPDSIGGRGPTVFATAGIFPLQSSFGLSTRDKWMFGGQAGLDWGFDNQDSLTMAAGFFDYQNLQGIINKNIDNTCATNSADVAQSVPEFMQFGNSLTTVCDNTLGIPGGLVGLVSNYEILNINALYDMALFAPAHVRLSGDYAKNFGFNQQSILAYTGQDITPQTDAWQVRAEIGWPKVDAFGKWSVFSLYKYVERDAVLDSFTDSDFHQGGANNVGGTNVKGWEVGGNYGLMRNLWLTGRWLSGNVISGPQYGVDIMQFDINTRF
jgi:hypothetical protein